LHNDPIIDDYYPNEILIWCCFINNGLGIWLPSPDLVEDWVSFQQDMNDKFGGLKWEFTPRSSIIDYMDLIIHIHIHIQDHPCITSTLFEKALNLHLYIPPHSAHLPRVLSGLVMGVVYYWFHTLCTDANNIQI
jgi:hypothetical protein